MAVRYRKIDPRIWNDEKFRALTDDGKFAFVFLLTHPHMTALGAMRGTLPGLAAELGWTAKRFASAVHEAATLGLVEACREASWVGIPNFLRYNEPEGPNSVTKAWVAALDLLPECQEKLRLIQRCRSYLETRSHKFKEAMGDGIWQAFGDGIEHAKSEPCPIQEQEQEQEPEQDIPPAVDEGFEEFWNRYPMRNGKRVGRSEALRKWQRIPPDQYGQVLIAVQHYATSKTVSEGIGIKDPHRWLRNGNKDEPWREWIEPEHKVTMTKSSLPRTCTKRIHKPGDLLLSQCGAPPAPNCNSDEPRCIKHFVQTLNSGAITC
ncbi:MAG: hypothetical protein HRU82_11815 [Nitrospira sp.]|nr:MAG: hypothetical protein HRU82_11815 [Nitrospira sp.]